MSNMNTQSALLKVARPGREILFKRSDGRGRPALGKVIKVDTKNHSLLTQTAGGKFERVRPNMITRVVDAAGKAPAIDPLTLAKAEQFEFEVTA